MVFINVNAVTDPRTKKKGSRVARTHDIKEHIWVAKPQLFDRPRCRWEDNIKVNLEDICRESECVQLAQDGFQWLAFANVRLKVWVFQTAKILLTR